MMRTLHPARMLRYMVYLAVAGTMAITTYTLFSMVFDHSSNKKEIPAELHIAQEKVNYVADKLDIKYSLIEHIDYRSRAKLSLTNTGDRDIRAGNWSIYIFYMSPIDTDLFNYGTNPEPWFRIYRMQGNLYRLTPTNYFSVMRPSDVITFEWTSGTWILAYTDILPNWYVWSPGVNAKIIGCTRDTPSESIPRFVEPFPAAASVRVEGDPYPPFTPDKRYKKNLIEYKADLQYSVVPTPLSAQSTGIGNDHMVIGEDWVIVALSDLLFEANYLKDKLGNYIGQTRPSKKFIQMTIGNIPLIVSEYNRHKQGYYIEVDKEEETVSIVGQSPAGVFYAVQTFISMYNGDDRTVPVVKVSDAPRLPYRGIMMDLSRNFHSNKREILRVLEALGMYKMNKLHLHLADDEGWRLEIPGLPELTQVGGFRCHDLLEEHCIIPGLGSGPHTNSSGSGYLSVSDYKEILTYASERHIEIIPEFDMPGHGRAAIRSMEARYRRLLAQGKDEQAREFLISDPVDRSMFMSGQFFTDNAINPCMESTYNFVEHVMVQVQELHKDINPLSRFHFGGDEVPENAFMESPACAKYMSSHPELLDTKDLKIHFIKRIAALAARHNIGIQGWEDSFYGKDVLPMSLYDLHGQKNVVANVWWNMWEGGIGHRANELANHDYKVVISHATHLYFDHIQEPDPAERGLYWSIRFIDSKRVFGFIPGDIYDNIDQRGMGEAWSKDEACGQVVNCVKLHKPDNVIGLQGSMWAETVRTRSNQNMMLFPRVLALAERAWHKAPWEDLDLKTRRAERQKDWARFATIVGKKELKRLEEIDIHYRLPPPGAIKMGRRYLVNTEFPGVVVQYSSNGGATWNDWYDGATPKGEVLLASRSSDGKRRSRVIKVYM